MGGTLNCGIFDPLWFSGDFITKSLIDVIVEDEDILNDDERESDDEEDTDVMYSLYDSDD